MQWETVIGLEVHIQLATQSKLFSGSSTTFGAPANAQADEIDLGLPGVLPSVNQAAIDKAIAFGLGIHAEICRASVFERKHYFYPDLPKGYQTTQLAQPIVGAGFIEIPDADTTCRIRIHHAHLEEDAGKSLHGVQSGMSGIDLNRAGVALLEVVSEPDMRTAQQAVAYVKALHTLVRYLGVSDGNMAQGSLRCDANVSVRPKGQTALGTRCEIKNINSFKFIEKAIEYEAERQIDVLESGGTIVQQTRLYDANAHETRAMRSKEEANDYRYFPCPDLLPVLIDHERLARIQATLPELPDAKKQRFIDTLQLSAYDAHLLSQERPVAEYFEQLAALSGDAKLAANWVMGDIASFLNDHQQTIEHMPVSAERMSDLLHRLKDGTINNKVAKQIFLALTQSEQSVDSIIQEQGLQQTSDTSEIEPLIEQVLSENPQQVQNYQKAPENKQGKMLGFFVGKVMQRSQGKANPAMVNQLLRKKLAK